MEFFKSLRTRQTKDKKQQARGNNTTNTKY